jgi:hypothetical protein
MSQEQDGDGGLDVAAAEEGLFALVRKLTESQIAWARSDEAQSLEHGALEEHVQGQGFEWMRLLAQGYLRVRAVREQRRTDVTDADGDVRVSTEAGQEHTRTMVFGAVVTERIACRRHRKPALFPQDSDLNWSTVHGYSAGVVKHVASMITGASAERTAAQITAITLGKRQVEELAVGAAVDFGAFYAARRPAPCPPTVAVMIQADGSALPVRPEALREATARAAALRAAAAGGWPDEPADLRRSKTRSAELVAVADVPPQPRTPAEVLVAVFGSAAQGYADAEAKARAEAQDGAAGSDPPGKPAAPKATGKTVLASVIKPIPVMIGEGFDEALRRDPELLRPWYAVVDGNNSQINTINKLAERHRVQVPVLIDFIHAVQYLWKAAGSFFDPGDPAARAWVIAQAAKLLAGKARDVWTGIRRRATTYGYRGAERKGADDCATYLENKRDYLDYPAFLAAGWSVASGLIEGAARWLVKDRMDITGARWGLDGAEAVLRLRAIEGNGDFDDYFTFHQQQEKQRNHDSRYHQPEPAAA